ncbi:MAG TPA: flagellar basal body-associated FliL family protein [Phycisphaerae bacterium]|nr:flagellar basal body-associated FliL family protein [Phycisphaerae bacterium]
MAKDTENPFEEESAAGPGAAGLGLKLVVRVGLMVAVLAVGAVAGYALGGLLRGSPPADPNGGPSDPYPMAEEYPTSPGVASEEYEYIHFEPIIANLNLPRLERYIRATITFAIRKGETQAVAKKKIEDNTAELRNHLNGYLSGQTLEDVRGPKNLNRIRREILERCNELIWPKRRPLIDHVLFKEFTVQ